MPKITATIITLNEEKKLERCLSSLVGWVDEVVLVDCGSRDQTVAIAKQFKAKVFYRAFDNFASQKNYAMEKASGGWIFSIDADEVVSSELATEIKQVMNEDKYSGYLIPRRNFILGAEIKHSRWTPDRHIWLWRKGAGMWEGEVHEEVRVNGEVGVLKSGKIHYQDETISQFMEGNLRYAKLLSTKMFREGKRFSVWRVFWDPMFEFAVRYIYKVGFLDGWRGLVLALLMAFYRLDVWMRILLLQLKKR